MKKLLGLALVFLLFFVLAMIIGWDDGYVTWVTPSWRIQISMATFILSQFLLIALLWSLLKLIHYLAHIPQKLSQRKTSKTHERAYIALTEFFVHYWQGDFHTAQLLIKDIIRHEALKPLQATLSALLWEPGSITPTWLEIKSSLQDINNQYPNLESVLHIHHEILMKNKSEAQGLLEELKANWPQCPQIPLFIKRLREMD